MKIALPIFGNRISPRFDCAPEFLIVRMTGDGLEGREKLEAVDWPPRRRVRILLDEGVETVVCGAIDCFSEELLRAAGVTVFGWQTGEIDDVLECFAAGELKQSAPRRSTEATPRGPRGRGDGRGRGQRQGRGPIGGGGRGGRAGCGPGQGGPGQGGMGRGRSAASGTSPEDDATTAMPQDPTEELAENAAPATGGQGRRGCRRGR